jgi:predicted acyl esterase
LKSAVLLSLLLAALAAVAPAASMAAEPPAGATWSETYFTSSDGTRLHADVLRPEGLAPDEKTPVLLTVSPYTNHSNQNVQDFDPTNAGPSSRFYDFIGLSNIFERGYTYVMVDLPGTGGSGGCNDWGGPAEQAASASAVEWAAAQPWSTGKVGMIGKSYDGWTGLMAIANRPQGLAAVVSMEPVYDGYRYLYTNGVRFTNSIATPGSFTAIDAAPGTLNDTPEYHMNGNSPNAACYVMNIAGQQSDEADSDFWQARELIEKSRGATTPLFLTQGYLESNTKPDGAFAYYNGMAGPKRAWFGQFDHVRGWETASDGELQTGRAGFIEETMRFLDHYVKGVPLTDAPTEADPPVAVQSIDGRYRSEAAWPPADSTLFETQLLPGTYTDDGQNSGSGSGAGQGIWSLSQPLPHDVHLAGEPVVEVELETTVPRANLAANVYDVDPEGRALMISRGAHLIRDAGKSTVRVRLYGQDWPVAAGHRLGVVLSSSNSEWFQLTLPTNTDVTVSAARIQLPFLRYERKTFIDGTDNPRLRDFLADAAFDLPEGVGTTSETTFELPPALEE